MGNLQLWKRVPAVADSSLLHLVHLLEKGLFPLQKLVLPHFLHSKPFVPFHGSNKFKAFIIALKQHRKLILC